MAHSSTYTCPHCNTSNSVSLFESFMLVCKSCHEVLYCNTGNERPERSIVPADWSFIQIGTEGGHKESEFRVVGRIRLQLRNDYKNLWCATVSNANHIWLMESFGSISVLGPTWEEYDDDIRSLHAGARVKLFADWHLEGEYVEKCEELSYEGELGKWNLFEPKFFFIQCSNGSLQTAIFTVFKKKIMFLKGKKVTLESLNLKNILTWDEWK